MQPALAQSVTLCYFAQVVVSGALDYSKPEVQADMEALLSRLENTTYIDPLYTESWLRSFLDYVERWKDYPEAFFRDVIGNWLNKRYAKAIVLTIFLIYLGVASWGVTQLKEGLEKKRLSRFDSYSVEYYEVEDKYFREYPFRINVSTIVSTITDVMYRRIGLLFL